MQLSEFKHFISLSKTNQSQVFRAYQESLNRTVILKSSPHKNQNEIDLSGQLKNPFLISTYDSFSEANKHFLVQELFEGIPLSHALFLTNEEQIKVAYNISKGLQLLHQKDFIHGDIHPQNILINPSLDIKIIDLGFTVKSGQQAKGCTNLFQNPEFCKGEVLNYSSDLYSLGLTLYLLVTKKNLLNDDLEQNAKNIVAGKLNFKDFDHPLCEVIKRLLRINPQFEDYDELEECLQVLLSNNKQSTTLYSQEIHALYQNFLTNSILKQLEDTSLSHTQKIYLIKELDSLEYDTIQLWKSLEAPKKKSKTKFLAVIITINAITLSILLFVPKKTPDLNQQMEKDLKILKEEIPQEELDSKSITKKWVVLTPHKKAPNYSLNNETISDLGSGRFLEVGTHQLEGLDSSNKTIFSTHFTVTNDGKIKWTKE